MLHRIALRVLPSLTLPVTEDSVRTRKRIVMLVPGLIAFGLYRLVKLVLPLGDPLVLLPVSGLISLVTAGCAYRVGSGVGFGQMLRQDGLRRVLWILGWIGFVYGTQLSLLVLALLWMVGYDYAFHPDGPAMMAIIIACTAVARDAFEIGTVRALETLGRTVPTFPNGDALRTFVSQTPRRIALWVFAGGSICAAAGWVLAQFSIGSFAVVVQVVLVSTAAGTCALAAYLAGKDPDRPWYRLAGANPLSELARFWWWPGAAFAVTYYAVGLGIVLYVFRNPAPALIELVGIGAFVGGLLSGYCFFLGHRRQIEDRMKGAVPSSLLRCPFILGMLGKTAGTRSGAVLSTASAAIGKSASEV